MSDNLTKLLQTAILGFFLASGAVGAAWVYRGESNPPLPGPPTNPVSALTAALKDDDPERVRRLANLWAGMAAVVPPECKTLIDVERANRIAGTTAVGDLGGSNEAAREAIVETFKKLAQQTGDSLDDADRQLVSDYFNGLSEAAAKAL